MVQTTRTATTARQVRPRRRGQHAGRSSCTARRCARAERVPRPRCSLPRRLRIADGLRGRADPPTEMRPSRPLDGRRRSSRPQRRTATAGGKGGAKRAGHSAVRRAAGTTDARLRRRGARPMHPHWPLAAGCRLRRACVSGCRCARIGWLAAMPRRSSRAHPVGRAM